MSPKEESKSRGVKQEQSRGLKYNAIGAEKMLSIQYSLRGSHEMITHGRR